MASYRRFIPPPAAIGGAADVSVLAGFLVERLRLKEDARHREELGAWANEGGSAVEAAAGFTPIIGRERTGSVAGLPSPYARWSKSGKEWPW